MPRPGGLPGPTLPGRDCGGRLPCSPGDSALSGELGWGTKGRRRPPGVTGVQGACGDTSWSRTMSLFQGTWSGLWKIRSGWGAQDRPGPHCPNCPPVPPTLWPACRCHAQASGRGLFSTGARRRAGQWRGSDGHHSSRWGTSSERILWGARVSLATPRWHCGGGSHGSVVSRLEN